MRVALYARVSTPRQGEEDKVSIPEQAKRIEKYCQEKAYTIADRYVDVGYSGAKSKRPEFQRLLSDAQAGRFDIIVAWKADRLARGIYPTAALMEAIENTSITIETEAESFDRTTFEIRAVLGRIEVENIAQRTQMGREGRIKAGDKHPKPCFGWNYDAPTKQWVINESEAEWMRRIFDWYTARVSPNEVARRLNTAGVPTKMRSTLGWTPQRVSTLVSSEIYMGDGFYNKRQGRSGKRKSKNQWVKMSVPPIISREVFEAAQATRESNRRFAPRNTKTVYLTQHVLVCQECGRTFMIHSGTRSPRLVCRGMTFYPHLYRCREPKSMPYRPIADRLWNGVKEVLASEASLEAAVHSKVQLVTNQREIIQRQLKELAHKRDGLKLEQDRVITWARKGGITEEQLDRQLRAIQAEDEQYAAEEDRLLADLTLDSDAKAVYEQAKLLIPIMRQRLSCELTDEEKWNLIRLLVRRTLLDKEANMTIELKIPVPEGGFGYFTSPHGGSPHCSQGLGGAHGCAIGWT